jgi:glycosyltransferase involved in cell wall biosynthesis
LEKIKWRLNRACYHAAAHLVTWSAWAKQGLIDGYGVPAERITVIPPGVNSAEWDYPARRYDDGSGVKILFVGGNLARKGGLLLLDAFRTLRQQQPDAELHLVTRDSVLPQPGVFVYHDMQPNSVPLKRLYRACDIFCLPSYGDCLPMVLSEAGATGLPLVATDVAGMPEIARDGDTGIAIPAGDEAALTAALLRLATDMELRARFGRNARRLTQTHFDAPRNAAKLLTLLKNVADGVPITAPALPIPQPLTPNP